MNFLEVKDLKTYFFTRWGTVKAVDGVSFSLKEGETLGLGWRIGMWQERHLPFHTEASAPTSGSDRRRSNLAAG